MSLGDGGLDAQVEQRMDAYRGNPQQLQKRYGQNKELMDLLALQKLKTEKDQIAAAMAMEAQQQPGTIAEQREAEALEQVKKEQAGSLGDLQARTKGTLDQKQKMQGKGMNKIAQSAGKPPQQAGGIAGLMGGGAKPPMPPQGGPQAAGLPNARMMQAARGGPVRRMAQGGIVGFAGGEEVEAGEAVRKRILALGITAEAFAAMPEAHRRSVLDSINDRASLGQFGSGMERIPAALLDKLIRTPLALGANLATDFAESRVGTALGLSDPSKPPAERAPMFPTQDRITTDIEANQAGLDEAGLKSLLPRAENPETQDSGDPLTLPEDPSDLLPPAIDPIVDPDAGPDDGPIIETTEEPLVLPEVDSTLGTVPANVRGTVNDLSGDVARRKGMDFANEELNRDANNQSFEDMKARMAEFDKENYSPNEDLNNFLIGMGGTGSMGAAMKGGKAAMDKSRTNRRNRMVDEFLMEKDRMGMDADLGKAGLVLANQMSADANANERNMRTVFANMTMKQMDIARADADRIAKRDEALLVSSDRKLARDIQLMNATTSRIEVKRVAATKVLTEIAATRDTLRMNEEATGPDSGRLQDAIDELTDATKSGKPRRIAGAEAEVAAIRARIYAGVETTLNNQGRLEQEELAKLAIEDVLVMPTLTGTVSSVRD
jgi:hypothetical protein